MADPILVAKHGDTECHLLPSLANRHGLITGATGTGKTVTLQSLAERFSYIGVPVFMADVKGDLSGMGAAGSISRMAAPSASSALCQPSAVIRYSDAGSIANWPKLPAAPAMPSAWLRWFRQ